MFTYKYYENLIKTLQNFGYVFSSFESYNPENTVYLRHDIDIDIFSVLKMAEIENENKVKSIWFFQPNNDVYNMLGRDTLNIISRVEDMGHQVGLHIDASIYKGYEEMIRGIRLLFDFYKNYIPLARIISFHRPAPFLLENFKIQDFIGTYEERFFKDITYVSDSGRREFWKEGRLSDAINKGKSIQLLTHPIWWKEEEYGKDAIVEYIRNTVKTLVVDRSLKTNCKLFQDM